MNHYMYLKTQAIEIFNLKPKHKFVVVEEELWLLSSDVDLSSDYFMNKKHSTYWAKWS